jgi:ribonuclease Z
MARLTILGTAAAISDATHDSVYMVLRDASGALLIDCAGSPMQRLALVGIPASELHGLIITHHHPDHVYGVPILLLSLSLLGRTEPIPIYGLPGSLNLIARIMDVYEWDEWPERVQVEYNPIAAEEKTPVLSTSETEIIASPTDHILPSIGLRLASRITGRAIVYSSDTAPTDSMVRLAEGADILIHEATGASPGHSDGTGAGEVARRAGVRQLVLIHYPIARGAPCAMLREAEAAFGGPVKLAKDFEVYEF